MPHFLERGRAVRNESVGIGVIDVPGEFAQQRLAGLALIVVFDRLEQTGGYRVEFEKPDTVIVAPIDADNYRLIGRLSVRPRSLRR